MWLSGQLGFVLAAAGSAVGVGMKSDWIAQEMERGGKRFRRKKLYSVMIRFVMPVIMLIIFGSNDISVERQCLFGFTI